MIGVDKRIIVKDLVETENKTKGGLFIPEITLKDKQILTGTVIASYEGCELSVGDKVKYTKFAGVELEDENGDMVRVCRIGDILVKI